MTRSDKDVVVTPVPDDPRLRALIAAAADPYERAEQRWCHVAPTDHEQIAHRRTAWSHAVTNGDDGALTRLLAARGIDHERFTLMLSDVDLVPDRGLPRWAVEFLRVLDAAGGSETVEPFSVGELLGKAVPPELRHEVDAPWSLNAAAAPLLRAAIATTNEHADRSAIDISAPARRQLVGGWARRLATVITPTLMSTPSIGGGADAGAIVLDASILEIMLQPHATRDAWLDVFALYPVLARVVGTASFYWREATLELIARVAADRTLLAREFADGAPIACVDSIESDAGDVHRGGRAVAIVGFDGGRHVVYKPKNLDVGAALVGLLGELSTESAGVSPRSIVTRGAYTWEQFVPTAPTDDPGVARFYRRYGELIRIVQALGGYDITYENLVAHGDRPEIIDLETMFRAPSRYGDDSAALDLELLRRSLRGPGATAMLSTGVGADVGRRALRMSPLEADDSVQAPFRQPRLQRDEEGRFRLGWEYTDSPRDNPVPQVDGVGADPREHLDEVLVGYRNMDERLAAERSQLTAPDGPLAQLGGAPVRFLNRNSYIYSRMIQQSLSPDRLVDGVRREIEIDRFWKSLTVDPHGAAFIADEVNAVRQLDIPLMQSLPGSTDVILNDERVAADVFHRPALPGLLDELASLNAATRSTNLALVRSHLHCIDPRPQLDRLPTARRTPSVGLGDAVDIARAVAEQAVQRDGRVGWTGLSYNPTSDLWSIGRLPIDLLSGIAGIGIALAEIAVATADARTTTLAETTFDTLCAAAKQIPAECERARTRALTMRGASFIVGGLTGIGAPLHGIARIAHLLDLDRGRAVLEHALEEIDVEVVRLLAADDVVGGLPGLLDNLSVVRRYIGHGAIDQIIDELSVERTDPPPPPIPDGSWILEHAHVGWEANGVGHAGGDSRATSPVRPIGDVHLASSPTLLRVLQARPTADAHSLEEALGELARRRSATGSWFPDLRVDPRHHLSAVYGMCAVGRAIVQLRSDVECPPLMVAPTR